MAKKAQGEEDGAGPEIRPGRRYLPSGTTPVARIVQGPRMDVGIVIVAIPITGSVAIAINVQGRNNAVVWAVPAVRAAVRPDLPAPEQKKQHC
jgi:hypothetical protein